MASREHDQRAEIMYHLTAGGIGFRGSNVIQHEDTLEATAKHIVPESQAFVQSLTAVSAQDQATVWDILKARGDTVLGRLEQAAKEN